MADYIIRIELRGDPSSDIYNQLHTLMKQKSFGQTITGQRINALPHATYYGSSQEAPSALCTSIHTTVTSQIWTKAIVLAVVVDTWAIHGQ
jgi:hypothetical protein